MRATRLLPPSLLALLALFACAGPVAEAPEGAATSPCRAGCSRAHPDCGGWVRVAYDVSASGAVENPRVLDSCPAGAHDAEVLALVSGWQYPASEDGQRDIRIQIDFAATP